MTATARAEPRTVDWKLWVPGVAAPIACFLVDFAAGEYVLQFAPAALLSLAAIGVASLVISRNQRRSVAGLATVGPMWMVGGVTLALGIPLAVVSGLGLFLSFVIMWRNPQAVLLLAWALLGLTPLWTGVTYLTQASALTKRQVAVHGGRKTRIVALAAAAMAAAIVIAAQAIDSRFIHVRVGALNKETPQTWQVTLQFLNAYHCAGVKDADGSFANTCSGNSLRHRRQKLSSCGPTFPFQSTAHSSRHTA